jgi:hypothetical protein
MVHQQREPVGPGAYFNFLITILITLTQSTPKGTPEVVVGEEDEEARLLRKERVISAVLSNLVRSSPPNPLIFLSLTLVRLLEVL